MGRRALDDSTYFERSDQRLDLLLQSLLHGVQECNLNGVITYANAALHRVQADEALRQSESRYRHHFENAIDCIHEIDLAGEITCMNMAGLQMLDLEHEQQVIDDFEAAYSQRDADSVSFHTHKLKSSARTVGAGELADACHEMELAGRKADWNEIDRLSVQMRPAMERVRDYIAEL